ncbi:MAG: hypothetical protein HC836_41050 [Richelia sp. RM2_1_2]|nr:hypothetical protein [Richelia sp. RM2_1_2]
MEGLQNRNRNSTLAVNLTGHLAEVIKNLPANSRLKKPEAEQILRYFLGNLEESAVAFVTIHQKYLVLVMTRLLVCEQKVNEIHGKTASLSEHVAIGALNRYDTERGLFGLLSWHLAHIQTGVNEEDNDNQQLYIKKRLDDGRDCWYPTDTKRGLTSFETTFMKGPLIEKLFDQFANSNEDTNCCSPHNLQKLFSEFGKWITFSKIKEENEVVKQEGLLCLLSLMFDKSICVLTLKKNNGSQLLVNCVDLTMSCRTSHTVDIILLKTVPFADATEKDFEWSILIDRSIDNKLAEVISEKMQECAVLDITDNELFDEEASRLYEKNQLSAVLPKEPKEASLLAMQSFQAALPIKKRKKQDSSSDDESIKQAKFKQKKRMRISIEEELVASDNDQDKKKPAAKTLKTSKREATLLDDNYDKQGGKKNDQKKTMKKTTLALAPIVGAIKKKKESKLVNKSQDDDDAGDDNESESDDKNEDKLSNNKLSKSGTSSTDEQAYRSGLFSLNYNPKLEKGTNQYNFDGFYAVTTPFVCDRNVTQKRKKVMMNRLI